MRPVPRPSHTQQKNAAFHTNPTVSGSSLTPSHADRERSVGAPAEEFREIRPEAGFTPRRRDRRTAHAHSASTD